LSVHPHPARPLGLWDLYLAFSRLSLMGFGGVLPIAQRELVERLGWLTQAEFTELLSIGQVLPGPNVVNLSLTFGDRCFGTRGALVAMAGMISLPMVLVLLLAGLYQHAAGLPWVVGAVRGMGAVSAGLIFAMGLKLIRTLQRNPLGPRLWMPLAALAGVAVGVLRWPLVVVVLGLGTLSWALTWWRLGRATPFKDAA
jgi:chromate transporter